MLESLTVEVAHAINSPAHYNNGTCACGHVVLALVSLQQSKAERGLPEWARGQGHLHGVILVTEQICIASNQAAKEARRLAHTQS